MRCQYLEATDTHKECHGHAVKDEDKKELEEVGGMGRQSCHPVGTIDSLAKRSGRAAFSPYTVETIIVGISRSGIMSKKNREKSQDVGL